MSKTPMPKTIVPAVIFGAGGLGWLFTLYVKLLLQLSFGPRVARLLCVAVRATDSDDGSRSLALPESNGRPAVSLDPGEYFIPRAYLVQELRAAGLRDPLLAPRAQRLPEGYRGDTSTGSGKCRPTSRMILAAEHHQYEILMGQAFSEIRSKPRIDALRAAGITPLLDRPTTFLVGINLAGGYGVGVAPDLGVMAGHCQEQEGAVNARRIAIGGAPESAGSEVQCRANMLGFYKDLAQSIRHPGQYISRGFGGRTITCDGPCCTDFLVISRTNSRLVAPDRAAIALQMAYAAVSLVVGDVAATIESRATDARRHLADVPDSHARFLMRVGVAAANFSRPAVVDTATDVLASAVAQYLCVGAS